MNATQGLRASMMAALLIVAPAVAFAADLPVRSARPGAIPGPPPPIPLYNWSGFYVGGNVGGGFESSTITEFDPSFDLATGVSESRSGFVGGGQIGYNWQFAPSWVIGVEWMFDGTDIRSTETDPHLTLLTNSRVDWFTTVTGRLGFAANNWLFYGKAGGGWIHESFTFTDLTGLGFGTVNDSNTEGGWAAGAGIEYGITPNWTIRVDYTHIGLSDQTEPGPLSPFDVLTVSRHFDFVTAGANYKF